MLRFITALLMVTLTLTLTAPPPASAQPDQRCFPETGFCIAGRIRAYWEQNGGLPVFGFPTGPQQTMTIEGRSIQAQWFERNRLELHPENAAPYDVLLGRLGADRLNQQGRDWNNFPRTGGTGSGAAVPRPDCRTFPETRFRVCGALLDYYTSHGLSFPGQPGLSFDESLALFGLPLSDERVERLSDGRTYTVQWFERARFEYHPENQPPYQVLLGLLGNEMTRPEPRGCALEVANFLRFPYEQAPFHVAMGCPHPADAGLRAAVQYFERGRMIWVDGIVGTGNGPTIFVIYDGPAPSYALFGDFWAPGQPERGEEAPPPGLIEPLRGFGKVWREHAEVRRGLGWAVSAEQATTADAQYFDFGAVLLARAIPASSPWDTRATYVFGPAPTDVSLISY